MEHDGRTTPASPFRLGGLTGDHPPATEGTFSFWTAVCFTLNYIMGKLLHWFMYMGWRDARSNPRTLSLDAQSYPVA